MEKSDLYKTIHNPSEEALFKDRNSKFYGYAYPIKNEDDVKLKLQELKKAHYAARHWCYAYQLGTEKRRYRANDDGEPNNSAGMPIYGQIQSYDLTNILIVVVRYFGGVKLGVGGLINAYRTAASLAIEQSKIIEKTIDVRYEITFGYPSMNTVMRIVKEKQLKIVSQQLRETCMLEISVRKTNAKSIFEIFKQIHGIQIREL